MVKIRDTSADLEIAGSSPAGHFGVSGLTAERRERTHSDRWFPSKDILPVVKIRVTSPDKQEVAGSIPAVSCYSLRSSVAERLYLGRIVPRHVFQSIER